MQVHTARSAQREPPPGLVLEVGGTSTLQAAMPVMCKVEVPPTSRFQVGGDFSSPGMAAA